MNERESKIKIRTWNNKDINAGRKGSMEDNEMIKNIWKKQPEQLGKKDQKMEKKRNKKRKRQYKGRVINR